MFLLVDCTYGNLDGAPWRNLRSFVAVTGLLLREVEMIAASLEESPGNESACAKARDFHENPEGAYIRHKSIVWSALPTVESVGKVVAQL